MTTLGIYAVANVKKPVASNGETSSVAMATFLVQENRVVTRGNRAVSDVKTRHCWTMREALAVV